MLVSAYRGGQNTTAIQYSSTAEGSRPLQARLEDHRRQKAEQEAEQGEREVLRQRVRAELEARVKWLRGPDAILRALNVPLEMEPGNPFRADLTKTVRKARLTYHPDRHQVRRRLLTPRPACAGRNLTPSPIAMSLTQLADTAVPLGRPQAANAAALIHRPLRGRAGCRLRSSGCCRIAGSACACGVLILQILDAGTLSASTSGG